MLADLIVDFAIHVKEQVFYLVYVTGWKIKLRDARLQTRVSSCCIELAASSHYTLQSRDLTPPFII
jgi:hypothetical protein